MTLGPISNAPVHALPANSFEPKASASVEPGGGAATPAAADASAVNFGMPSTLKLPPIVTTFGGGSSRKSYH